ncbi:MAG: diacylglycerol kinase family protein [Candidatus Gottesmanbacteria bacterium]
MEEAIRRHRISFKNAFDGLFYAFTSQPNFKIHFFLASLALLLGFFLEVSFLELIILVIVIIFGLTVEMMNTSIESITDLVTKEWRQEAKIAKDVAAGMMLLTAIGTVIVALLIFIPRLTEKFL